MVGYSGYGKDGIYRPRRKLSGALTAGGRFPRFKEWTYIWHYLNGIAARFTFMGRRLIPGLGKLPEMDQESREIAAQLSSTGYHQLGDTERKKTVDSYAALIFDKFDVFSRDKAKHYSPEKYVTKKGYMAKQGKSMPNQIYMDSLDSDDIQAIRGFFEESGLSNVFRSYFKSNFGVCNVRVWRYFPMTEEGDGYVKPHVDNFPPNVIKIMYYRDEINAETSGCLELLDDQDEDFYRVTGSYPTVIFDPNNLRHQAMAPTGEGRDCIEITVIPHIGSKPIFVDAGFQAGFPLNPFKRWDEPALFIKSM